MMRGPRKKPAVAASLSLDLSTARVERTTPSTGAEIPTPGAGLPSSSDEAKPITPKAELPSTDRGAELSLQLSPAEFPPIPAGLPSSSLARATVIGDLLYPAGIGFHLQEATALTDEIAAERERVECELSHSGPTASLQLEAPLAALSLLAIQAPSSPARTPAECFGEGAVSRSPVVTASTSHPVRSVTSNSIMHSSGWTKNVRKRRSRRAAAAAAVFPRPPGQPLTLTKIIQACCKVWDVSVTSGPARGRKRKLCELLSVTSEMLSSGAPLTFHLPSSTPARAATSSDSSGPVDTGPEPKRLRPFWRRGPSPGSRSSSPVQPEFSCSAVASSAARLTTEWHQRIGHWELCVPRGGVSSCEFGAGVDFGSQTASTGDVLSASLFPIVPAPVLPAMVRSPVVPANLGSLPARIPQPGYWMESLGPNPNLLSLSGAGLQTFAVRELQHIMELDDAVPPFFKEIPVARLSHDLVSEAWRVRLRLWMLAVRADTSLSAKMRRCQLVRLTYMVSFLLDKARTSQPQTLLSETL